MLFALDENKTRTNIHHSIKGKEYFCPICGEKLILKKGNIRAHHYAHNKNSSCKDIWNYDMSIWHVNWQNRFNEDYQEIIREDLYEKHRADVLIEDKKLVYEFQHSRISSQEFNERNAFYNSQGYKVIWVFDVASLYDKGSISDTVIYGISNVYAWEKPYETFIDLTRNNFNIEIYFELVNNADDDEAILDAKNKIENGIRLGNPEDFYYERHKNDKAKLIKVKWWSSTFKTFISDGNYYTAQDVVDLANEEIFEEEDEDSYPTYENGEPETVCDLWVKYDCHKATFLNVKTRNIIKIISHPIDQYFRYNKVYGFLTSIEYGEGSREIYSWRKKQWKLLSKS